MSYDELSMIRSALQENPMVIASATVEAFLLLAETAPENLRVALAEVDDHDALTCLSRVSMSLWEVDKSAEPLHPFLAEKAGTSVQGIQAWEVGKQLQNLRVLMTPQAMNHICNALERYLKPGEPRPLNEKNADNLHGYFETCALLGEPAEKMQLAMMRFARVYDRVVLPPAQHELVLSRLLGFAVRRDDTEAVESCLKMVPDPVTSNSLAFNLACNAARSKNQPDLLRWTTRALELGKSADVFHKDPDFEAYRGSAEFEALLK